MINLELHFIINEFMATCPCPPTIKCEIYMNLYYVIKQMWSIYIYCVNSNAIFFYSNAVLISLQVFFFFFKGNLQVFLTLAY